LGFGPLEPLLARDDIADIMVNGATRTFIEVGGKIQLTNMSFRDNNAVDEHLPAHRQPGRPPRR
jgi:Flp pilus assembly CpaF family ATPase